MVGEPRAPARGHLGAARLRGLVGRRVVDLLGEVDELADARAVAVAALDVGRVVGPDLVEEDGHGVLRLDVRRRLELDDPGAEPLGRLARRLQPVEDVGLGVGRLGAAGDGHAQPFERARPVARAQRQRRDDRVGVDAGLGGQGDEQRAGVGDAAGHRAGVVERRAQGDAAVVGDAAVGRLDRADARRARPGSAASRRCPCPRPPGPCAPPAPPPIRRSTRRPCGPAPTGCRPGRWSRPRRTRGCGCGRRGPRRGRAGAATPRCRPRRRCPRARGSRPSARARRTAKRSLSASGIPHSQRGGVALGGQPRVGGPRQLARRARDTGATQALMAPGAPSKVGSPPLRAAIRAWHASSSSTADSARERSSAAASSRPRSAGSVAPGSVTDASRAAWPRRRARRSRARRPGVWAGAPRPRSRPCCSPAAAGPRAAR